MPQSVVFNAVGGSTEIVNGVRYDAGSVRPYRAVIPDNPSQNTPIEIYGPTGQLQYRTTYQNLVTDYANQLSGLNVSQSSLGVSASRALSNVIQPGVNAFQAAEARQAQIQAEARAGSSPLGGIDPITGKVYNQAADIAKTAFKYLPAEQKAQIEQQQFEVFKQQQARGELPGTAVFNPEEIGYYGGGQAGLTGYVQTVPWYQQTPPPAPPNTQGQTLKTGEVIYKTQQGEVAVVWNPREQTVTSFQTRLGHIDYTTQQSMPIVPFEKKLERTFGKTVEVQPEFVRPGLVPVAGQAVSAEQFQGTYLGAAQTGFEQGYGLVESGIGSYGSMKLVSGLGKQEGKYVTEIPKYAVGGLAATGAVVSKGISDISSGFEFYALPKQGTQEFEYAASQNPFVGLNQSLFGRQGIKEVTEFGLYGAIPFGGIGSKAKTAKELPNVIIDLDKQSGRTLQRFLKGELGEVKIGVESGKISGKVTVESFKELPFGQTAFGFSEKGGLEAGRVLKLSVTGPVQVDLATGLVTRSIVGAKSKVSEVAGVPVKSVPKNILGVTEDLEKPLSFETGVGKLEVTVAKMQKEFVPLEEQAAKNVSVSTVEQYSRGEIIPTSLERVTGTTKSRGIETKFTSFNSEEPSVVTKTVKLADISKPDSPLLIDAKLKFGGKESPRIGSAKKVASLEVESQKELGVATVSKVKQEFGLVSRNVLREQNVLPKDIDIVASVKSDTREFVQTTSKGVRVKGKGEFVSTGEYALPEANVSIRIKERTGLKGNVAFTKGPEDFVIMEPSGKYVGDWARGFQQTFQVQAQAKQVQVPSFAIVQREIAETVTGKVIPVTKPVSISYAVPGSAVQLAESLPARPIQIVSGTRRVELKPVTESEFFGKSEKAFVEKIGKESNAYKNFVVQEKKSLVETPSKFFEKNVAKEVSKPVSKEFEKNVAKEFERNVSKDLEKPMEKNLSRNLERNLEKNLSRNMERNLERTFERNLSRNLERTFERQLSRQTQRQLQREIQTPVQRTIVKNPPRIILVPPIEQSTMQNVKSLVLPGLFVGVTKKGGKVFRLVGTEGFSYQESAGKTAGIVKNTLRASFKAVPFEQVKSLPVLNIKPKSNVGVLPSEFYRSKQGWSVQKKERTASATGRISSLGEKLDIRQARQQAELFGLVKKKRR